MRPLQRAANPTKGQIKIDDNEIGETPTPMPIGYELSHTIAVYGTPESINYHLNKFTDWVKDNSLLILNAKRIDLPSVPREDISPCSKTLNPAPRDEYFLYPSDVNAVNIPKSLFITLVYQHPSELKGPCWGGMHWPSFIHHQTTQIIPADPGAWWWADNGWNYLRHEFVNAVLTLVNKEYYIPNWDDPEIDKPCKHLTNEYTIDECKGKLILSKLTKEIYEWLAETEAKL